MSTDEQAEWCSLATAPGGETSAPGPLAEAPGAPTRLARWGRQMTSLLIIGIGGFLGANCRYLVGAWAAERFGVTFPYGTLLINVTGCFVIGLFLTLVTDRFIVHPQTRLFFAVGFLGAYTTFSSYAYESFVLLQSRAYLLTAANLIGSVVLGMVAVILGVIVGRLV